MMEHQSNRKPSGRALLGLLLGATLTAAACTTQGPIESALFSDRTLPAEHDRPQWREDPIWFDGQAEIATYRATQSIYGIEREYLARAYTNVQRQSRRTTTKSAGDQGVEVFKHHWSERIPTERYDYDFSTATFVERKNLAPFKLTFASQEDCGASFKQWQPTAGGWSAFESTYFPEGGERYSDFGGGVPLSVDMLSLVLRSFPFDQPPEQPLRLRLIPSQRSTRTSALEAADYELRYVGSSILTLPAGQFSAHELELARMDVPEEVHRYAFAAQGEAPWLHVMLTYFGPGERRYLLDSLVRDAYWER